jgi:hypothetical protein
LFGNVSGLGVLGVAEKSYSDPDLNRPRCNKKSPPALPLVAINCAGGFPALFPENQKR